MSDERDREKKVRIDLTDEQREQVEPQIGPEAEVVEFTADELEERIAPHI